MRSHEAGEGQPIFFADRPYGIVERTAVYSVSEEIQ
jgi:hypothetical protein